MLNILWGSMILIGILFSALNGRLDDVTNVILSSSKETVNLCITMLGIMATWTGLLKIAERAGLIDALSKKMMPLLIYLFPDIPIE